MFKLFIFIIILLSIGCISYHPKIGPHINALDHFKGEENWCIENCRENIDIWENYFQRTGTSPSKKILRKTTKLDLEGIDTMLIVKKRKKNYIFNYDQSFCLCMVGCVKDSNSKEYYKRCKN